jgi:hypothetical protein
MLHFVQSPNRRSLIALPALLLLVTGVLNFSYDNAYAQAIPLPPPIPNFGTSNELVYAEDDQEPPVIEVITTELKAGKNVFQVRITDDSTIQLREVRFVQDGKIISQGLNRDQNDIYKALIDIQPPAKIVVVNAGDVYGQITTVVKEYEISESSSFFDTIIDAISEFSRSLERLFSFR